MADVIHHNVNGCFNVCDRRHGEYHIATELLDDFGATGELRLEASALLRALCHLLYPGLSGKDRQRWSVLFYQMRDALPRRYFGETNDEIRSRINDLAYEWLEDDR